MLAACGVIHGEVKNLNVQRGNAMDNKYFEEFSEAAQVEIYRSASLQLNIVKLKAYTQISL